MNLSDVGKTISKYAPLLGAVVGGAPGGAIGSLVATAFGADPDKPEDMIDKIKADPQAGLKLVEIQSNCEIELQKLAVQMAQVNFDNTKDARDHNVQSKSWMPEVVSIISMIGFFGCIFMIAQYHQEAQDEQVLYMLLGSVSMSFGAVINYWLGSSSSSKEKDRLIRNK